MKSEIRVVIRLVALWIIFGVALYYTFWSVAGLATSTAKAMNGGYETYYGSNSYGTYSAYCLQAPLYPQTSGGMMITPEDKAAWDKYNQEQEKYNQEIATKCQEDASKQEVMHYNEAWAYAMADIGNYVIASLFSLIVAVMAYMAIRKGENTKI